MTPPPGSPCRFAGRVAVVTGAAGGIGSAVAHRLAAEGASVALADVSPDVEERASAIARRHGVPTRAAELDVAAGSDVTSWINDIASDLGSVDVLVNNAGLVRDARTSKMSDQHWNEVVDVVLRGSFNCCRAAMELMVENRYGRIVSMASISRHGAFGQANYAAAKSGIVGLARTIALEGARYGVTSNVISPGPIDTAMLAALDDDLRSRYIDLIPVGRVGSPDDVAEAVAYLCSEAAGFVTGSVLEVDGGISVGVSLR